MLYILLYIYFQTEKYYLRAVGDNPRTDIADINKQFSELAEDISIPPFFSPDRFFSSVFRISSNGIQLWTHYDVNTHILCIVLNLCPTHKCVFTFTCVKLIQH